MGLFSEIRDAVSSSPVPAFKREWLKTCQYIQTDSASDSRTMASAKILSQMTVLADYCANKISNPHSAKITVWWQREFEISVEAAFYIAARYAELWAEGIDITNSVVIMVLNETNTSDVSYKYNSYLRRFL